LVHSLAMFGLLDQPLPVVKDLPSPEGVWELVEVIGKYSYLAISAFYPLLLSYLDPLSNSLII